MTISNPLYQSTFTTTINKMSSFKNVYIVQDNSISQKGNNRTITLAYDSLGEPSCSLVWLSVGLNSNKPFSCGTNAAYCSASFASVPFIGVYNKTNNSVSFSVEMSLIGLGTINFLMKNDIESIKLTTSVTISSLSCNRPVLEIINRSSSFLDPRVIFRSKSFSIISKTSFSCSVTLNNIKKWNVFEVNANTGLKIKAANLTTIFSVVSAELFIPSNYLDYGTYLFVYQVMMDGDASSFINSIDTYVRIVPTGVAVLPFSGGIKEITIGNRQAIELDPGRYSYDLDDILMGTDLTYKFYCRIVIDGLPQTFQSDSNNYYLDLQQIKNLNLPIQICFSSTGIIINIFEKHFYIIYLFPDSYSFSNLNTKMTINSNALQYIDGISYQFLIVGTTSYGSQYSQYVKINVFEYNYIPLVNLG